MKRGRNQRRRQGVNVNRALDSNGPDVRIRGTANQIYDKYQSLARDASSSGDRVKAESYLQHAEHYFRLIKSMQPQGANNQNQQSNSNANEGSSQQNTSSENSEETSATADSVDGAENDSKSEAKENASASEDGDQEKRPKQRRSRRPRQSGKSADASSKDASSKDANDNDGAPEKADTSGEEKAPAKRTRRKKAEPAEAVS